MSPERHFVSQYEELTSSRVAEGRGSILADHSTVPFTGTRRIGRFERSFPWTRVENSMRPMTFYSKRRSSVLKWWINAWGGGNDALIINASERIEDQRNSVRSDFQIYENDCSTFSLDSLDPLTAVGNRQSLRLTILTATCHIFRAKKIIKLITNCNNLCMQERNKSTLFKNQIMIQNWDWIVLIKAYEHWNSCRYSPLVADIINYLELLCHMKR